MINNGEPAALLWYIADPLPESQRTIAVSFAVLRTESQMIQFILPLRSKRSPFDIKFDGGENEELCEEDGCMNCVFAHFWVGEGDKSELFEMRKW